MCMHFQGGLSVARRREKKNPALTGKRIFRAADGGMKVYLSVRKRRLKSLGALKEA